MGGTESIRGKLHDTGMTAERKGNNSVSTPGSIAESSSEPATLRQDVMDAIGRYADRNYLRATDRANDQDYTAALVTHSHAEAAHTIAFIMDGVLKDHNL